MGKLVVRVPVFLMLLSLGIGSLAMAEDERPQVNRVAPVADPHVEPGGGGGVIPLSQRKKAKLNKSKVIHSTSGRS